MRYVHAIAAITALALLAGCGAGVPTRAKAVKNTVRPMATMPAQNATPAGADQGKGLALLAKMRESYQTISGFEGDLIARTQGYYKQGVKGSELRRVTVGYKVQWAKPAKFKAEVTSAADAMMQGAGMTTLDGVNITARAKGLLSFVPIQIKANEPKLGNARNHTFDKFCPNAQIERLMSGNAVWTVMTETVTPEGKPMALVAIDNVPRLDREITREVMGIELQTLALRSLTAYAGNERATDYTFSKFRWNPKVTADTFKL